MKKLILAVLVMVLLVMFAVPVWACPGATAVSRGVVIRNKGLKV